MFKYYVYKVLHHLGLVSDRKYNQKEQKYGFKTTKEYKAIAKSKLFDAKWYLKQNPDVKASGMDPVLHYLKYGWKEGRNPSILFNGVKYLRRHKDVAAANINPLLHWIFFGQAENRLLPEYPKNQSNGKKQGVIYTCITGGYDNLILHTYQDPNWDYVCFTDNTLLLKDKKVGPWYVKPLKFSELDNVRNARWHKTHPHLLFPNYKYSIWMDGNIDVKGTFLFDKADLCIKEKRILSVPAHPKRTCIYDEAVTVKALKKDFPAEVDAEIAALKRAGFPRNVGLNETNILFRFHKDPLCITMMEDWFQLIRKYSRRDQLSFNYVVWRHHYKMKNFSDPLDVRYNPENFAIVKSETHSATMNTAYPLTMTIIIPVYNALDDLKTTLDTLCQSNLSQRVKVLLINDGSNEETTTFLRNFVRKKKQYRLMENEKNMGFVKTCNRGMKEVNSDIVILLNSDVMVPKRFEERVNQCFNFNPKIGIASPLASSSGLWDLPYKEGMTFDQMDKLVEQNSLMEYPEILCPEGFCFCVRKQVIDELGYLDEIFGRGYCEETEFAMRAMNAGWKTVLIDNLYLYHKRHASFGASTRKEQIEKNKKILWGRWQNLYDRKMKKIQMPLLKERIHNRIYNSDSALLYKKYKDNFIKKLKNYTKFPNIVVNNTSRKPTVNILIPAINQNALTAGPLGILFFGRFLQQQGINVRFLQTEVKSFDVDALHTVKELSDMIEKVEFEYIGNRNLTTLEINENDVCVATLWNAAYIAEHIQSKCKNKKFIYMIQDYEPIFYPNSSISALIEATYRMNYNAMFSTDILRKFFNAKVFVDMPKKESCFFDTASLPYLPDFEAFKKNHRNIKKKFVFYGRPHRERNMFDLGCYIIQQAIERKILPETEWEFYSIGYQEQRIRMTDNTSMKALPYMSVKKYSEFLGKMDLGLALMMSPHPSMTPIDLALSGGVVVTNTYANKTEALLQEISKNILASSPDIESILQKLKQGAQKAEDLKTRYENAWHSSYVTKYTEMFSHKHLKWFYKLYPEFKKQKSNPAFERRDLRTERNEIF